MLSGADSYTYAAGADATGRSYKYSDDDMRDDMITYALVQLKKNPEGFSIISESSGGR